MRRAAEKDQTIRMFRTVGIALSTVKPRCGANGHGRCTYALKDGHAGEHWFRSRGF